CSRHLSRSQAEIPLISAVQISRTTSERHLRHFVLEVQHRAGIVAGKLIQTTIGTIKNITTFG
ncbi:hypothetical protein, partial [Daeguia caeni]|uniref:hypothetical protein n=1 Tax=Daeguia caeni TaxID=439612 RepID=UPI0035BC7CD8